MSFSQDPRMYVIKVFSERGVLYSEKYASMLAEAQPDRTIDDLRPWAFDRDPQSAIGFCSEAVGREVFPFAQAIGQDLMACFLVNESAEPSVVIINPWSSDSSTVVQADLADFDAWLTYAKKVSQAVLVREQDELDED